MKLADVFKAILICALIALTATWPAIAWGLGWFSGTQAIGFGVPSTLFVVLMIVVVGSLAERNQWS